MNKVSVKNGEVGKDIIGGDQYNYNIELPPIDCGAVVRGLERFQEMAESDEDFQYFLERLEFFTNNKTRSAVIGLEQKLVNGGRSDLVDDAIEKKDHFAKRFSKSQLNPRRQWIYLYILQKIKATFESSIRPLIKNKARSEVIDMAIYNHIVDRVYSEVIGSDPTIDQDTISGMLYFLTGKCHLIWD
ncbi:ABC-three component system protein [Halomonas dongshanensis]|uniref:ABC-three component systems C-terminal domain-containing protein n=1 Tax=Halomonas dongshanensis TaxID=2890835 RepID=A0ABT2EEW8_9GAMM|nr:ABC-three component system protein [Halomonas dongshanensis]MCS2609172.1 hypothetical protein [Halomonas dongshanensis]